MSVLADTKLVIVQCLGLDPRMGALDAQTALLGSMPEMDSLGVVQLAMGLEQKFGITIDDEDFSSELFATVGSLADYVEARLAQAIPARAAE